GVVGRHPVHHGGQRHAAVRALWQRSRSVHADAGADCGGVGSAGQSACLPRHHRACTRVWPAVWRNRTARLACTGETARALLAHRSCTACGGAGMTSAIIRCLVAIATTCPEGCNLLLLLRTAGLPVSLSGSN